MYVDRNDQSGAVDRTPKAEIEAVGGTNAPSQKEILAFAGRTAPRGGECEFDRPAGTPTGHLERLRGEGRESVTNVESGRIVACGKGPFQRAELATKRANDAQDRRRLGRPEPAMTEIAHTPSRCCGGRKVFDHGGGTGPEP